MLQGVECSEEDRRLTLLTALTLPLRDCRDDTPTSPKQRQSAPAHIILTALKWKRKDAESVALLHAAAPQLLQCCHEMQASSRCLYTGHSVLNAGSLQQVCTSICKGCLTLQL